MKIIIIGEDVFSVQTFRSLVEDGHDIQAFVTPAYNKHAREIQKVSEKYGICFRVEGDVNGKSFIEYLKALNPELLVTVHFERLICPELIKVPTNGCINIHPSLLPQYKGLAPQHWPIINGDKETGITIHYIDEGMDTGKIILQEKIEIAPDEYISDLQFRMLKMYGPLMCQAIKRIASEGFRPLLNNPLEGSYYPKLKLKDTRIDLLKSKNEIYNLIRGVSSPYMGAHYEDRTIWHAIRLIQTQEDEYCQQFPTPGFYEINEDEAILRVSDGVLLITSYE